MVVLRSTRPWLAALVAPVVLAVWIVANAARGSSLLADSDTRVLLSAIRERNQPFSWFLGDWPLANHFYRPVSTLTFELDNAIYGNHAAGYGLTNALLAAACVLLVFWLVRELFSSSCLAGAASALFGLWHVASPVIDVAQACCLGLAGLSLVGMFRGQVWSAISAAMSFVFLSTLLVPSEAFDFRIVGWLPGRTASTMTLFCLLSLGAMARYARLATPVPEFTPTALDVPATKSTRLDSHNGIAWPWAIVAIASCLLAFGSYEQAVMLPACATGVAIFYIKRTYCSTWLIVLAYWASLFFYLGLRFAIFPPGLSGYQDQQFRSGPGVVVSLMDYVFPAWNWGRSVALSLSTGLILILTSAVWVPLLRALGNLVVWRSVWKSEFRSEVLSAFGLTVFSFLPMAWLKTFGHYHYWPSAFRAVFAVLVAGICLRLFKSAVSLREIQAPARPNHAPGSLRRL